MYCWVGFLFANWELKHAVVTSMINLVVSTNQTFANVHVYVSNLLPTLTIPITPSNLRSTFYQLVEEVWKDFIQIQWTQGEKWEALGLSCDSAVGLQ